MKYTEMELKVIEAIRDSLNYDKLEDNIEDNATCLEIKETARLTGLDTKSLRGIFSSLEKKGLMFYDEWNLGAMKGMMVTELGLREYYRLFENTEETEEETNMVKVIERATGNEFKANKIEGGYEVFTLEGEKYKKLKDSTFKKYFKLTGESAEEPKKEQKKAEKKAEKKAQPTVEVSDEKKDKLINKIRKILALAKDNPSMEEGLAAAKQAQELMMKYNIHQEDVELEEVRDEIGSVFSEQKHDSQLHGWRKDLAVIVGRNFRCKVYVHNQDIVFRGYVQDAKIALEVYMNLYTIGNKGGSKAYHDQLAETGSGKGAYNSYVLGFLKGIEEGLGEQCTALMIVVPKEVEEEFEEFSANFRKGRGGIVANSINGETYAKGKRDGKAAVKARAVEKKGK